MGYDQNIYNKVGTLEHQLLQATSDYAAAKATKQALDTRVETFKQDLAVDLDARSTAQSNFTAATNCDKSILGAMLAAAYSTREAMAIYIRVQDVFGQAIIAAQQMATAGYSISSMLDKVTAAEAKNAYMTPQLLTGAQAADSTATTAASAADTVLEQAMNAYVAAGRSLWASSLVMAAIVDLQRIVGGYTKDPNSDALGIPDQLDFIPATHNLLQSIHVDPDFREIDTYLIQWLYDLVLRVYSFKGAEKGQGKDAKKGKGKNPKKGKGKNPLSKSLEVAVNQVLYMASGKDFSLALVDAVGEAPCDPDIPHPVTGKLEPMAGMLCGLSTVLKVMQDRTKEMQAATNRAIVEQSVADQHLAKRKAAFDAANAAVKAAHQAVDHK